MSDDVLPKYGSQHEHSADAAASHSDDLLDLYALGVLDPDDVERVEQHLSLCERCRMRQQQAHAVAGLLAFGVEAHAPPDGLFERIEERIRSGRHLNPENPAAAGPARHHLRSLFQLKSGGLLGLASAAIIVLLLGWNIVLHRQLNAQSAEIQILANRLAAQERVITILRQPDARLVAVSGTDTTPKVQGSILLYPDGTHGFLAVDGLPPLPAGKAYQLWLVRQGQRASGGLLRVDENGRGTLLVEAPQPLGLYENIGMTLEPDTGSPGPTGPRVLGARLALQP